MSLSVGIVGLANVGKSTLFNALLKRQQAMAANYPFATIEPNVGIVPVPDERLHRLALVVAGQEMGHEQKEPGRVVMSAGVEQGGVRMVEFEEEDLKLPPEVSATVEFHDIAGLVAGAHKGEGLGNKFLAHIREVDLMAHVVRDFEDGNVVRVGSEMLSDYQTTKTELILKDLESVERKLEAKSEMRVNPKLRSVIEKLMEGFNEGRAAREILSGEDWEVTDELFLLTAKPEIVVVNVAEGHLAEASKDSTRVGYAQKLGVAFEDVVVVSAKIESEIATLADEDAELFMRDLGVGESGLTRLIGSAYGRLGLISFLTAGEKEVRAWTIRSGMSAVEAAGVIHTDFMKAFIKAEVIGYGDYVEFGGRKRCRELGKARLEGREYVVADGDVIEFKIGS